MQHESKSPLDIVVARTMREAIERIVSRAPDLPPIVLPSSGSRRDSLAAQVRQRLRELGVQSSILPHGRPGLPGVGTREAGRRVRLTVSLPDNLPFTATLPERLATASTLWAVTDIDRVAGRGPYVLDLLKHHLSLVERLRLQGQRGERYAAELLLARPMTCCLVGCHVDSACVAAGTDDPIAAELVALALAEDRMPPGTSVSSIWEDPLVQRATELGIGVRYPGDIVPSISILGGTEGAREAVDRILSRMGVRTP